MKRLITLAAILFPIISFGIEFECSTVWAVDESTIDVTWVISGILCDGHEDVWDEVECFWWLNNPDPSTQKCKVTSDAETPASCEHYCEIVYDPYGAPEYTIRSMQGVIISSDILDIGDEITWSCSAVWADDGSTEDITHVRSGILYPEFGAISWSEIECRWPGDPSECAIQQTTALTMPGYWVRYCEIVYQPIGLPQYAIRSSHGFDVAIFANGFEEGDVSQWSGGIGSEEEDCPKEDDECP